MNQSYLSQIADWILARSGKPAAPTFDMSRPDPLVGMPKGSSSVLPAKKFTYLPMEYYVAFDEVPAGIAAKVFSKLDEIFVALPESEKLSEGQIGFIRLLLSTLSETSRYVCGETAIKMKYLILLLLLILFSLDIMLVKSSINILSHSSSYSIQVPCINIYL